MNAKSKNALIAILALTTSVSGVFAWLQYRRADELDGRIAKLAKTVAERTERDQRRGSSGRAQTPSDNAGQTRADASPDGERGPGREERRENMRAVWNSPEAAKVRAAGQRRMIDARYAGLFKSLNLTPDQLEKVKTLLAEKQNAARDVMSVAREQGLDFRGNRDEFQQLIQQAGADIDGNIAALIGQDKFAQYQNYEQTQRERAAVGMIEQSLSYTSEPLSQSQSEQLVSLLAANATASSSAAPAGGPPGGGPMMGGGGFAGVEITDQVIAGAQSFLSASQVESLRQIQSEQSDQKKLQELMSSAGGGRGGDGPPRGRRGGR